MKRAERILLILIIIGIVLKTAHIPGGNILTVLATIVLAFFYLIGSYFLFNPKVPVVFNDITYYKPKSTRVVLVLLAGYMFSMALIGILFRLMHWPGAAMMLLIGALSILPIVIISLVKFQIKKEDFFRQITIRSLVMIILSVVFYFCELP